ncbi:MULTISPECIES: Tn3 family transposase [Kordiimonas]|jgi:TnpA family transposase|uniref:Tn3 family transposase n=1 Tax=Kordiimonas TaxID=288021 RepID=UPI00257F0E98|nr:Tn3 family transposase [Kordiimonas sp. UBA4487]
MAHRPLLKEDEWHQLMGVPADEESLIQHYLFDMVDIDRINSKRRSENQLGFAVQLCLMRYPGRALQPGEAPPRETLAFIAGQLGIDPAAFADYARRDETRREHAIQIQEYLNLSPATRPNQRIALTAGLDAAEKTDNGLAIAEAMVQALRNQSVLLPSFRKLDRLGRAARAIARARTNAAVLDGLNEDQLFKIDRLLEYDPQIRQTRFGWLRSHSESPGADNLVALMERLEFVRSLEIDMSCKARIHPDRWKQIVREGKVTPSWLAADFNVNRRRATIAAQIISLSETLTDEAVSMFTKLIGRLFSRAIAKSKQRHIDKRKETNQTLRLFRDTLNALIAASENKLDAFTVLEETVGWQRLVSAKPNLDAMVTEAEQPALVIAAERYYGMRKYAPQFLETFTFQSGRTLDPLLSAIDLLKQLNRNGRRSLPDIFPMNHLRRKERTLIMAKGSPDKHLYEIATLSVLRERLRSGDIWVDGSTQYRPVGDDFIPKPEFEVKKETGSLQLGVPTDFDAWHGETRRVLDFRLKRLAYRARNNKLEGVRLVNGELIVSPLTSDVPASADELKWRLNQMLPRIHITDLLAEVNGWLRFSDAFTHLRTQQPVRQTPAIQAAVLADATNMGMLRMAGASSNVSERQIAWARLFHMRPETYRRAQAVITNAHAAHPHSRVWGAGTTSSSDGQFYRAGDRARLRSDVNMHYGREPGGKFYSHLSDQYGYYSILPISPAESEAPYVLDGLLDHETNLQIGEHYTDTGGASDHVFGLFCLLGKRFAPRLRDLKGRKFHTIEDAGSYPFLRQHIGHRVNIPLVRENWNDLLHLAVSLDERVVAPSKILKKLSASPKASQLSRALRDLGRLERTLFMIEWYSDPALRRRCQGGLNKGEAAHKLKRAVFFHERGEIRDRSFDSQAFRASGLNLVVSAIVYWNTVYLARCVAQLKMDGTYVPDELLKHVSPISWEHINLTGIYTWREDHPEPGLFRELRKAPPGINWAA